MKKVFTMFLAAIMICVLIIPAFAKEDTFSDSEDSYSVLERAADSIPNIDKNRSVRFCDLSSEAAACLEENGINTDCIGEIFYQETENEPALVAVSYGDNNQLVISTLTSFAKNEDGDYVKVPLFTIQNRAWAGTQISNAYPFTQLTVTSKLYLEYYFISLYEVYYRPYMLEFWYTNNNGYTPSVANFYADGIVRSKLCTYTGTNFTITESWYDWYTSRTVAAPSSGIHYTQLQYMTNGYCLDVPYYSGTQGYLYINGSKVTFTINYSSM